MNSEEWKARIRHWVNQIANEMAPSGNDFVVLAAKRNNSKRAFVTGQSHDPVTVEAGAIDQALGLDGASRSIEHGLARAFDDGADFASRQDLAAAPSNEFGIFLCDDSIIRDAGTRDHHGGNTGAVRLDLAQLLWSNHREAWHAIRRATPHQFTKACPFGFVRRNDNLSADFIRNVVFAAKIHHLHGAGHAVLRF